MFQYFQLKKKKVEKKKHVIGDCLGINENLCISMYYITSKELFALFPLF